MPDRFSLADRVRSFRCAVRGIVDVVRTEHNAWIHLAATGGVISLGALLGLSAVDWALLVLAFVAVWVSEAINTALEYLADAVQPELHPLIGRAKDASAGAVLIAAAGSVVIGLLVLGPPLLDAVRLAR